MLRILFAAVFCFCCFFFAALSEILRSFEFLFDSFYLSLFYASLVLESVGVVVVLEAASTSSGASSASASASASAPASPSELASALPSASLLEAVFPVCRLLLIFFVCSFLFLVVGAVVVLVASLAVFGLLGVQASVCWVNYELLV